MADDTQRLSGDPGKPEKPRVYTFDELATLAASSPLPRGHRIAQADDTGDVISAWLDELSQRHPRAVRGRQRRRQRSDGPAWG